MSDNHSEVPNYPPVPTIGLNLISADSTSTSNIPVSDFRRNEVRPIPEIDDRHKSIYHQPSLSGYNPSERRRKRHRRPRPSTEPSETVSKSTAISSNQEASRIDNPSAHVQFLLGDEDQEYDDEEHKPHDLFIELDELVSGGDKAAGSNEPVDQGWKETARWVKFEEDVETGGRWSKPHVATLSLHSLLELRNFISKGTVLLDMHAEQLPVIVDMILDDMIANGSLSPEKRFVVRNALLLKHLHQHEKEFHQQLNSQGVRKPLPFTRSLAEFSRNRSQKDVTINSVDQMPLASATGTIGTVPTNLSQTPTHQVKFGLKSASKAKLQDVDEQAPGLVGTESRAKINTHFMKKVPPNAEATNVLVGAVDFLQTPIYAFIRLAKGITLPDLIEVPLPTRFLFILLGPCNEHLRYHEVGRSISTLMADEIFHDVAYRARNRDDLLAGIDDFLDNVIVLPPGEWDPKTRIEPPKNIPKKEERLDRKKTNGISTLAEEHHDAHEVDEALAKTGRFCGGLIEDIKRKAPFYWSDFRDGFSFQSVAAIIFLYFACLSPIITFGGLLSKATDDNMAAIESLLSGAICGILYHLFSGQPLTILGSTGPVLVFETIVNQFCRSYGYDYMNFRSWIGLWTAAILLVMVVTDASYLVKYITRFTEESFAALIGIIFIYEAFDKMILIRKQRPTLLGTTNSLPENCNCYNSKKIFYRNETLTISDCIARKAFEYTGDGCESTLKETYVPDVFFFSVILFFSTFVLAYVLKNFKFSRFLPMGIRSKVSDFGVVLAIFMNVTFDYLVGLDTPKLNVPQKFETTKPGRGWIINPLAKNNWYLWVGAIIPALLATILIFMDQQITAVIINRKENKLKKGCGYHLDLLIVTICIAINSILGLPWFVAATVLSINHVIALKLESETAAPGEKAKFLGVREQRVTGFVVFLLIGLSVFLTKFLRFIPMPVLYGVFLYMGISSMKEIQLVSRILLMFMPEKYQPDYVYLRHVRTSRVHIFTIIQLTCLALLWIIKSVKSISILFPIMVVALIGARKLMDYLFTQRELGYLDDVMPELVKKEIEERKNSVTEENPEENKNAETSIELEQNQKKMSDVSTSGAINFSEEVGKTFLWKSITKNNDKQSVNNEGKAGSRTSGIKNRIRKLSLNFLSPEEDRPLVDLNTTVISTNQQLPSIVIEPMDNSISNDPNDRRVRSTSTTSNPKHDTKL